MDEVRVRRRLVTALTRPQRPRGTLRLRQGVVQVVNGDGTLDITLGGSQVTLTGVARLSSYTSPTAGQAVMVLATGYDLLILGRVA